MPVPYVILRLGSFSEYVLTGVLLGPSAASPILLLTLPPAICQGETKTQRVVKVNVCPNLAIRSHENVNSFTPGMQLLLYVGCTESQGGIH